MIAVEPYPYNTFELLKERLTPVDIQNMAEWILKLPLQIETAVGDTKYLLAHAMTVKPGTERFQNFLINGTEGYIGK
ncbi:MAG: hypothetical protein IJA07_01030 [Agathobacter sp.]|nr:hypothetical protein [Agathobacter sp.]